jgi:hypothetical protein
VPPLADEIEDLSTSARGNVVAVQPDILSDFSVVALAVKGSLCLKDVATVERRRLRSILRRADDRLRIVVDELLYGRMA